MRAGSSAKELKEEKNLWLLMLTWATRDSSWGWDEENCEEELQTAHHINHITSIPSHQSHHTTMRNQLGNTGAGGGISKAKAGPELGISPH